MFEVIVSSKFFLEGDAVVEVTESFQAAAKVASGYSLFMGRDAVVRRCRNVAKSQANLSAYKRFIEG